MGSAKIPENIGAILHLSALAEVILQRKLNGKHVNALQLLEKLFGYSKNLFDPKRQSL